MPLYPKSLKGGELHFFGVSGREDASFAAGRVFIWRTECDVPELSIICILDEPSADACELISKTLPAAMVISTRALSAEIVELAANASIPYMIIKDPPSHIYRQDGKVALLDPARSILIVDPSLETLNRYPHLSLEEEAAAEPRLIKEIVKDRFLLDDLPSAELFEFLRDTSERLGAPPIAVMLDVPRSRREEDLFCENAEALFRAAVYGDLSVMLRGHVSDTEIAYSFSLMHKVFCQLQQEERDFNGYIKKGILISSPMDIMRRSRSFRPDFLCFDIDCLLSRIFGAPCARLMYSQDVKEALMAIWRRYLDDVAPECPFWVRSRELGESELLRDFVSFARVRDVYIDKK